MAVEVAAFQPVASGLTGDTAETRGFTGFELAVSRPIVRSLLDAQHFNGPPLRDKIGVAPGGGAICGFRLSWRTEPAEDVAHQFGFLGIVANIAMDIVCACGDGPDFRAGGQARCNQCQEEYGSGQESDLCHSLSCTRRQDLRKPGGLPHEAQMADLVKL